MIENGDVVRVTAKLSHGVNDLRNVYHVLYSGTAPVEDEFFVADTADKLDNAYLEIVSIFPTGVQFDTIEFFNITQDRPVDEVVWPTMTEGDGTGTNAAYQLAALVNFGVDAPRSSGRKYLGTLAGTVVGSGGTILAPHITELGLYAAELLADWFFENGIAQFGVFSKLYNRFAPYVTAGLDVLARTQRRRVSGVGS